MTRRFGRILKPFRDALDTKSHRWRVELYIIPSNELTPYATLILYNFFLYESSSAELILTQISHTTHKHIKRGIVDGEEEKVVIHKSDNLDIRKG